MRLRDRWRSRLRTAAAMGALCWARLLIAAVPFDRWRNRLGGKAGDKAAAGAARRLAAHVDWAARLLPMSTKCLPRAMALSWILRSQGLAHCIIFAVRPAAQRGHNDDLHAWVEVDGEKVIGDLPGPWIELLRLGS